MDDDAEKWTAPPEGSESEREPPGDLWGFSRPNDRDSDLVASTHLPIIEGYRITSKLGEGGMGTVWRAEQLSTHRIVALKLLKGSALASDRMCRRFEREVELAARLQHPNITRVFQAGQQRGVYFYAMELVEGVPLDQFVQGQQLNQSQILALMQLVCRAVQHAHQRGVIHRDLKPANILVASDGQPQVLDFGLAKAIQDDEEAGMTITREGATAGTPAYMSPEQASGEHFKIDTRTDVYALGVILYRLITNDHPHELTGSRFDVLKRIVEADARRPRIAHRDLDRDLEAILMKALARQPRDRYSNAGDLADDLDRFQRGDAVVAQSMTLRYLLWKQARKHRGPIVLSAAIVAALVALAAFSFIRITQARNESERRLAASLISEGDALALTGQWKQAKERYLGSRHIMAELDEPAVEQEIALWSAYRKSPPPLLSIDLGGKPSGIAPLADGRRVVIILDRHLQEYDLATGRALRRFEQHNAAISSVAVSPDGQWMASGDESGKVILWNLADGAIIHSFADHSVKVTALIFTPDSLTFLSGDSDGLVQHRVVKTGQSLGLIELAADPKTATNMRGIDISPDGRSILVSAADNRGESWNLEEKKLVQTFLMGPHYGHRVPKAVWSRDGTLMFTPDGDRIVVRASKDGSIQSQLFGHTRDITTIARAYDNEHFATGGEDRTVRVWGLRWKDQPQTYTDHTGTVRGICFLPGAPVLATVSDDGTCKVWTLNELHSQFSFSPLQSIVTRFSRDGKVVLIAQDDEGHPELWDVASGQPVRVFPPKAKDISMAALSPDKRRAVLGGYSGSVEVWDVDTETLVTRLSSLNSHVLAMRYSDDGTLLAVGDGAGVVRLWNTADWSLRWERKTSSPINAVAFVPGGVAVGGEAGRIIVHSLEGILKADFLSHHNVGASSVRSLCTTPDGLHLIAGGDRIDPALKVWDTGTWKLLAAFDGDVQGNTRLSVSPDGRYLASGSEDNTINLWDLEKLRLIRSFPYVAAGTGDLLILGADRDIFCAGLLGGWVSRWDMGAAAVIDHPPLKSFAILCQDPRDAAALAEVGQWHLQRGVRPWAIALMEEARDQGQEVSAFVLAQMNWHWRNNQLEKANSAMKQVTARDEADSFYLHLCRTRLEKDIAAQSKP